MKPIDPTKAKKGLVRYRILYFATSVVAVLYAYRKMNQNEEIQEQFKSQWIKLSLPCC